MDGFSVSPDELRQVANNLTILCDGLDEFIRFSMEPQAIYSERLRHEVEAFQERMAGAVVQLRDDTREAGHRLAQTADVYEQTDREGAGRVKVTGN